MEWFKKNWKFLAIVAAAVLVLSVVIVMVMPGQSGGPNAEEIPADGPETGVYYYDTAEGEYTSALTAAIYLL
jgi:hypothetical protein